MKRLAIILAFIILGCNPKHSIRRKIKIYTSSLCRHYPNDNPVAWEKICANTPYINGERLVKKRKTY